MKKMRLPQLFLAFAQIQEYIVKAQNFVWLMKKMRLPQLLALAQIQNFDNHLDPPKTKKALHFWMLIG